MNWYNDYVHPVMKKRKEENHENQMKIVGLTFLVLIICLCFWLIYILATWKICNA